MHEKQLIITDHAYQRYCERVESVTRAELETRVQTDLQKGMHGRKGYLRIGGIWWRVSMEADTITLHTCYGRSHLDIPEAVRWAKLHGDRIVLGDRDGF